MAEKNQQDIPEEVADLLDQVHEAAIEDELVLVRGRNAENGDPVYLLCRAEDKGEVHELTALAEIPEGGPGENVILPAPFAPLRPNLH